MQKLWGFVHNVFVHPLYVLTYVGLRHFWGTMHNATARWAGFESEPCRHCGK